MATAQEKAQCVLWLAETKSPITVQRNFRRMYHKDPPSVPSIYAWMQKFKDAGNVEHAKNYGRPSTSEENVERIRESFSRISFCMVMLKTWFIKHLFQINPF